MNRFQTRVALTLIAACFASPSSPPKSRRRRQPAADDQQGDQVQADQGDKPAASIKFRKEFGLRRILLLGTLGSRIDECPPLQAIPSRSASRGR